MGIICNFPRKAKNLPACLLARRPDTSFINLCNLHAAFATVMRIARWFRKRGRINFTRRVCTNEVCLSCLISYFCISSSFSPIFCSRDIIDYFTSAWEFLSRILNLNDYQALIDNAEKKRLQFSLFLKIINYFFEIDQCLWYSYRNIQILLNMKSVWKINSDVQRVGS